MGRTQWKTGKIFLGVSQFLIFKCSGHIQVDNAGLWRLRKWAAAGWESKMLTSAFTPLSTQPESALLAQPAGLAGEGAGRNTGIRVVLCAEPWCCWPWTASPFCCCSFSWVLVEHSLLAAGKLVTGSCWGFKVPQVFHRLLLSSRSFCFPVALWAILCFLTLSAPEANS